MVSKERKNRPKRKYIPQEKWDMDLENLRRQYEYGERKKREKQEVQSSSENQTQK
jgi:hypothetical protein